MGERVRGRFPLVAALVALAGATAAAPVSAGRSGPLIGMNLQLYEYLPPNCWGGHIILGYDKPGVRETVAPALRAMRAAGVETLRLQVVFGPKQDQWHWPIDSSSGHLIEPYRTNLGLFLDDIRKAGFMQVTVMFNPWGPNDPIGYSGDPYDASLFDQNWTFMQEVHDVVVRHWPRALRWDLINEGAPAFWQLGWLAGYVTRIYRTWVDAYGSDNVSVSTITKGESIARDRLQNLINALRASDRPLPTWFDVHPSSNSNALLELRAADEVLTRNGLEQPLVVGEESYENSIAAAAIATFVQTSKRPVLEVMAWALYADGTPQPRCPQLPLHMNAYWKALRGGPPPNTLHGWIGANGRMSLLTPFGQAVSSLLEGTHTITVRDTSTRYGFRLAGPPDARRPIDRRTGIRFKGTVTWKVKLPAGDYTYASIGPAGARRSVHIWSSD